jgi:predicted N-acetyltransferase YhbS
MISIRQEKRADIPAREALLDAAMGPGRFAKASERLREGRMPASGLSFVATENGRVIGTVRLWHVNAGPKRPALLLGPLAVAADARGCGVGSALVQYALEQASRSGAGAVLLVGVAPYYSRFGFSSEKTGALWLPGPYAKHRLLGCELVPGALDGATGLIGAGGRPERKPKLSDLIAGLRQTGRTRAATAQQAA